MDQEFKPKFISQQIEDIRRQLLELPLSFDVSAGISIDHERKYKSGWAMNLYCPEDESSIPTSDLIEEMAEVDFADELYTDIPEKMIQALRDLAVRLETKLKQDRKEYPKPAT